MSLYQNRDQLKNLTVKVGIIFSKLGLSPNQWTFLTILPAIATAYFIIRENFLLAAAAFILAAFFDLIDGSVARVTGRTTRLGAYFDTMMDRYVEALIIFSLFFLKLPEIELPYIHLSVPMQAWLLLYLFGGLMTTYAKAAAKEKNIFKEKELKGGTIERPERLIMLFLGLLLAHFDLLYLGAIIIILAVLCNVTALERIYIAYKEETKNKKEL